MSISDALKRMLRERKMRDDAELTEQVWSERMRVKEAFFEGLAAAAYIGITMDPHDAWQMSRARRNLYPGPPTPLHLSAKLRSRGLRFCDCRRPGGPGEGR